MNLLVFKYFSKAMSGIFIGNAAVCCMNFDLFHQSLKVAKFCELMQLITKVF